PAQRQIADAPRPGRVSREEGDREIQAARAARDHGRLPALDLRQGVEEDAGRDGVEEDRRGVEGGAVGPGPGASARLRRRAARANLARRDGIRPSRAADDQAPEGVLTVRIVDLHCYPGTREWIACQGPYVEALAKYWNRAWVARTEDEVLEDFTD